MNTAPPRLFTVGHSNHDLASFLQLLRGVPVTALADVRSLPFSQRWPQFNRPELEQALSAQGIEYVYLGDQLGGRPRRTDLYDADGHADYEKIRETPAFQQGLERLLRGVERYTIVLMCGEADPLDCHRGLMITPALLERGLAPLHLRRDGSLETTADMEERLLAETGVGRGIVDGLFAGIISAEERREILVEAYRVQTRRKAHRLRAEES